MSNRIHFLNTGYSDCIILESNGLFAMIDAAEDTDNPTGRPSLNLPGYEDVVVKYINENCKNSDGKIVFEFILGTHCHSDHIGGFDTVILQDNVEIKKAYLKPYYEEGISAYERTRWDNLEVYTQMVDALNKRNIPIIDSFDKESFNLGELSVKFFNGSYVKLNKKTGENRNSVVTLVEYNNNRALLVGDMNYTCGGEKEISDEVGKIDILKVGHHGYTGSTSKYWVKKLNPDIAVICNFKKRIYPDVLFKLKRISKSDIFTTADCGGLIIDMNDLSIETDIM